MMVAAKIDGLDVMASIMTACAPVAADSPDFAAMIASVGQMSPKDGSAKPDRSPEAVVDVALVDAPALPAVTLNPACPELCTDVPQNGNAKVSASPLPAPAPVLEFETVLEGGGLPKPSITNASLPRKTELLERPTVKDGVVDSQPRSVRQAISPDDKPVEPTADSSKLVDVNDILLLKLVEAPAVELAVHVGNEAFLPIAKPKHGDQAVLATVDARADRIVPQPPIVLEVITPRVLAKVEKPDPVVTVIAEGRGFTPQTLPTVEKPVVVMPDRAPTFTAQIADVARDVLNLTTDKDVRFTVRPETLGPVAVRIERGDAGPSLRLGVETQAAVQAVRQAEPMLNDNRGNAPFVQVTVDLNSPEQRGRFARQVTLPKPGRSELSENIMTQAAVTTGRFA